MNINIRKYIIDSLKKDSPKKIKDSIETTINTKDEDALIGLGVIFELLWINSPNQDEYLKIIEDAIKKN